MNPKLILFTTLFFCIICNAKSQTPIYNKATKQSWSGGVAGRHGNNYTIEVISKKDIIPDSIYIEGYCFSLTNSRRADDGFIWYKTNDSTYVVIVRYTISSGIEQIQPVMTNKPIDHLTKIPACRPPLYEGKALLVFYQNNQRNTVIIDSYIHLLELSYP